MLATRVLYCDRVLFIDNVRVRGEMASPVLERCVTDPVLSFRRLGGNQEISRDNDVLLVLTMNDAQARSRPAPPNAADHAPGPRRRAREGLRPSRRALPVGGGTPRRARPRGRRHGPAVGRPRATSSGAGLRATAPRSCGPRRWTGSCERPASRASSRTSRPSSRCGTRSGTWSSSVAREGWRLGLPHRRRVGREARPRAHCKTSSLGGNGSPKSSPGHRHQRGDVPQELRRPLVSPSTATSPCSLARCRRSPPEGAPGFGTGGCLRRWPDG